MNYKRTKILASLLAGLFVFASSASALSTTQIENYAERMDNLLWDARDGYTPQLCQSMLSLSQELNSLTEADKSSIYDTAYSSSELFYDYLYSFRMIEAVNTKDYQKLDSLLKEYKTTNDTIFPSFSWGQYDSPMKTAINNNDTKAIDILLEYDFPTRIFFPNVGHEGEYGSLPGYCVQTNNFEMLKYFYSKGYSLNGQGKPAATRYGQFDEDIIYAIICNCSDDILVFLWERETLKDKDYVNAANGAHDYLFYPLLYYVGKKSNGLHLMQLLHLEYQASLLVFSDTSMHRGYTTVYQSLNSNLKAAIPEQYRKNFAQAFEAMSAADKKKTATRLFSYTVDTDALRLRSDYNLSASVTGRLVQGDIVYVLEQCGNEVTIDGISDYWVHVWSEEKGEGYCFGGYLKQNNRW